MNNVHFSSNSDLWATPQDLFDRLNARWRFTLDVCATPENAKCPRFFTKVDDGLAQVWDGVFWMNPPYGREIPLWMEKAVRSWKTGASGVCLVPARTDTAWFQDFAMQGRVEFIRGRLKFGGHTNSAPFPSALIMLGEPQNG